MKTKPKPKKKPFRITGPGLYRTRDGRMAFVSIGILAGFSPQWLGIIAGAHYTSRWCSSGEWNIGDESPLDLISRWPGKKARRKS